MDVVGMGLRALNRVAEYSFIDGRMDPAESTYEARDPNRDRRKKGPGKRDQRVDRGRPTLSLVERHDRREV